MNEFRNFYPGTLALQDEVKSALTDEAFRKVYDEAVKSMTPQEEVARCAAPERADFDSLSLDAKRTLRFYRCIVAAVEELAATASKDFLKPCQHCQ